MLAACVVDRRRSAFARRALESGHSIETAAGRSAPILAVRGRQLERPRLGHKPTFRLLWSHAEKRTDWIRPTSVVQSRRSAARNPPSDDFSLLAQLGRLSTDSFREPNCGTGLSFAAAGRPGCAQNDGSTQASSARSRPGVNRDRNGHIHLPPDHPRALGVIKDEEAHSRAFSILTQSARSSLYAGRCCVAAELLTKTCRTNSMRPLASLTSICQSLSRQSCA